MIVLLALVGFSGPAHAKDDPLDETCKKPITIPGYPHTLKTIAEINAIRNWSEKAMEYGADYAQWHYARGHRIECEKIGKAGLFQCHAGAKPCRAQGGSTAQASSAAKSE